MLDGEIAKSDYQTTKTRYENIITEFKERQNRATDEKGIFDLYQKAINKIERLVNNSLMLI